VKAHFVHIRIICFMIEFHATKATQRAWRSNRKPELTVLLSSLRPFLDPRTVHASPLIVAGSIEVALVHPMDEVAT
jgi:hypothetical protein